MNANALSHLTHDYMSHKTMNRFFLFPFLSRKRLVFTGPIGLTRKSLQVNYSHFAIIEWKVCV